MIKDELNLIKILIK